ncbi:MAG: hypothetical protein ACXABY_05660 [Candidatus Thorarchaeota archaeon]|jgi:hypothetical protein
MVQGAENDLADIRLYTVESPVIFNRDNDPFTDLNNNTLLVDDKAILARDTASQAQIDLAGHIGQGGIAEHSDATPALSGFLSNSDKSKLDLVQSGAQLNILAPVDAINLISRKATTLHRHLIATTLNEGFMSIADKIKLNGIAPGAQVNRLSVSNATTLTDGSNADSLHTHNFIGTTETFTAAVHDISDHAPVPGIGGFPGFLNSPHNLGPTQLANGTVMHSHDYSLPTVAMTASGGRTLTFTAGSPPVITANSGDFLADGFATSMNVVVTGTTSNDGHYFIDTAAALTLTLDVRDVLVAEGPLASTATLDSGDGFTTLHVVTAGIARILEAGWFGNGETFSVDDVTKLGTTGITTTSLSSFDGNNQTRCWQGGYGV